MWYLSAYTLVMSLGTLQSSWTISGNAATAPILIVQFGWDEKQAVKYNSLINTVAILGLTVGSLTAGFSLVYGRRKTLIFWEVIALIGCGLTLIRHLATICIGRFILGVASGMLNVACGKSIDETAPVHLQGAFGALTNLGINFGIMIIMLLGYILPADLEGQKTDQNWRIIFAIPGFIAFAQIGLLIFFFKEEPIIFSITNKNLDQAKALYKKVYKDLDDLQVEKIVSQQQVNSHSDSGNVTFKDVICAKNYRKATWVCFFLNIFNQGSGIDAINTYAARLLLNLKDQTNGQFPVKPELGVALIGVANTVSSVVSIFTLVRFGRKTLLMFGQLVMGVCCIAAALCLIFKAYIWTYILILVFICAFSLGTGSVAWVYCSEVTTDRASGFVVAAMFATSLIYTLTMEYMMVSKMQAQGTLLLFGVVSLTGAIFVGIFIKETKGLSDKDKKTLFSSINTVTIAKDHEKLPEL